MKKRIKLKKKQYEMRTKASSVLECFAQYSVVGIAFLTLVWNYTSNAVDITSALYKDILNENVLYQMINELTGNTFIGSGILIVIFLVVLCIGAIYDNHSEDRRVMKAIYYKEILKIVKEIEAKQNES